MPGGDGVQVPPAGHRVRGGGEPGVLTGEQIDVRGQLQPLQGVPGLLVELCGGDPHARRRGAESEPRQPGAQQMPLVPLLLGDGEDGQHPAVGQPRGRPAEDPAVAVLQQLAGRVGQSVRGRSGGRARGGQKSAPLEPGDGGAHGRRVDPECTEQPDQGGDRHRSGRAVRGAGPAPPVGAVERDDQGPWGALRLLVVHRVTLEGVSAAGSAGAYRSGCAAERCGRRSRADICRARSGSW